MDKTKKMLIFKAFSIGTNIVYKIGMAGDSQINGYWKLKIEKSHLECIRNNFDI